MSKQTTKSSVPFNRRPQCSAEDETILVAQVNKRCPLCKTYLYQKKGDRSYKLYEIAHIYPHSPTPHELKVLAGVVPPDEVDDERNYIALCPTCHTRYDKGKTLEEYNCLRQLKDSLIAKDIQYDLQNEYKLKEDINTVIIALDSACTEKDGLIPLNYEPKKVDEKLKDSISFLLLRGIKDFVAQYYNLVGACFAQIEKDTGNASIIASKMKLYYLEQKRLHIDSRQIYYNMIDWILSNTKTANREAATIIVAYFIQHCEVFE